MKRFFALVLAVVLSTALFAGSAPAAEQYVMKFGHVSAPNNETDDQLMALFIKSYLESRSQGRIKVEIYPSGQLGGFREMLEQVQNNTLECTSTTVGGIASFMPEIQVTDLPYTIRDEAVAQALFNSSFFDDVRAEVLKRTGNIELVAVGNTGSWRNFATSKKKVEKVADLKGLKIRTIESDLQMQLVRELGAVPTPISMSELYTALSTGVVDGTKNSIGDYVPTGMAEQLHHILLDEHTYVFGFTWVSRQWLQSLPADLQQLVLDACILGTNVQTNFNLQYQALASARWLEMGNTIATPTPEAMKEFHTVRDTMITWFRGQFGEEWLNKWMAAVKEAEAQVDARNAGLIK